MRILTLLFILIITIGCCSNTKELESGEIKTLQLMKQAFEKPQHSMKFDNARNLIIREQIDSAITPVLFVELKSGQNGTLTPYPGCVGQTWLGADGATLTLEEGILKASRGMGNDIMGSSSSMPKLSKIDQNTKTYYRAVSYITGNNKIYTLKFKCSIEKNNHREVIEIWGVEFRVIKFEESCTYNNFETKNTYFIDDQEIVRKSIQYHSDTIGYITIERLDR